MIEDVRLQRIEEKLDKMSDAIIALARVEEKITDLEVRRAEGHERVNRMSHKLDDIDKHVVKMQERMAAMTKILWIVCGSILTAVVSHIESIL